jgi:nitronate monooxygenase
MITTALTEMFGLDHPIALAPMGGVAGGCLAAAVSNGGGLGLVGGGYGDAEWLRRELDRVTAEARRPWGIGLITWSIADSVLEMALSYRPDAFFLSFGDPRPYAARIKAAGCRLICQVQDVEQARIARDAGADLIVAQGTEAGGHGGRRATLPLVPAVVDAVDPVPVVAAGGIADGRGLAAAIMLGAHGASIGTRFFATPEAAGPEDAGRRIVAARASDTVRTRVFDIVRGYAWPDGIDGRALRNRFCERWHGEEEALTGALETERETYRAAALVGDCETAVVFAGEAVDLIGAVDSAAAIVAEISADAEACLRAGAARLVEP